MTEPQHIPDAAPRRDMTLAHIDAPFKRLVDSVLDYAIFLLDPEGRIMSWNAGAQRIIGYQPEEIIGRHFSVFYTQPDLDRELPKLELETASLAGRFEDEGWRLRKDGMRFWSNVVISAIRDEDGELLGFSKVTRDLTDRRENEARLRQSEERFRLMVENVEDYAIFLLDPSGHVASWNAGAQRMKGYRATEIIGRHFSVFYPPEAIATGHPAFELEEAARDGRFAEEGWRLRKDGSRFWANVVITALRDADGLLRGFSKITRDLTERRQRDEELRLSEEKARLLIEGVEDYAVYMLDPEGRVTSWNSGAQRITGYRADEIIGQSFERFYSREDVLAGRPADELRRAVLHRRAEDRGWRLRKDGSRFWADVVVTPLHDAHGRLRGFAKVTRDLSDQKRMEDLEEQGRHLTEFLAMLAHELRNPLAPIRNAVGIMSMAGELTPQVAWARDVIERQTGYLTRLVDDLLDVSRITRGKLRMRSETMDLNMAILRALEASRPLVDARKHRLHYREHQGGLPVHGDLTRLMQVVLNILNNAAKYTPEGGDIWIETAVEGDDVTLRVRDSGAGIQPQLIENIFDLFAQGERTIDRAEGGLGIGLTLARRIVKLHGGSIVASSAGPGKGAEFEVRLPRLTQELRAAPMSNAAEVAHDAGPAQSILVVDDNADNAASMATLLRMAGHDVVVAHDGPAALEKTHERLPDVVLLDLGLPGMSGYEVAKVLRERRDAKPLRIYAMTGYGQDADRLRSLEAGFDGHFVKPVMPNELLALIREVESADPIGRARRETPPKG